MGKVKSITNKATQSKKALIAWSLLFTALAYYEASRAIDTGAWLDYFATFMLVGLVFIFVKQLFYSFKYVKK